jgi:hypothetical protein
VKVRVRGRRGHLRAHIECRVDEADD